VWWGGGGAGRGGGGGGGRPPTAMLGAGLALATSALLLSGLSPTTPLTQLIAAYIAFGVGSGLVNAPITAAAVSGMPRAQAGLAAALASTGRQVGITLGVAMAGSMVVRGPDASGQAFAASTHPYWWIVFGVGCTICALAMASTSGLARRSAERVASLLDPPVDEGVAAASLGGPVRTTG
jgi:MFS family permease